MDDQPGPRPDPETVEEILIAVESGRAAGIVGATARVVAGDELGLQDEDVPAVYAAALERVAAELAALADRALRARTGGA